jgi:excisionase family DNA binding protein
MERAAWTPMQLAERWECSERHVRNLINRGELQFFRLGGRLVRIPHSVVEAFEQGGRRNPNLSPIKVRSPTEEGTGRSERTLLIRLAPNLTAGGEQPGRG